MATISGIELGPPVEDVALALKTREKWILGH
jgi:hypothetical protein